MPGGRKAASLQPRQIGRYFQVCAEVAAQSGLLFIHQLAAFDLGWLVRCAYESGNGAAADLPTEQLAFQHIASGKRVPQVVKAKLELGAFFLEMVQDEEAKVRKNLSDVSPEAFASLGKELLQVEERCFWEVTDRQVNFEWMPPERRQKVRVFLDSSREDGQPQA